MINKMPYILYSYIKIKYNTSWAIYFINNRKAYNNWKKKKKKVNKY